MNKYTVPFNKPFISGKELYYIADSVMKGQISGNYAVKFLLTLSFNNKL